MKKIATIIIILLAVIFCIPLIFTVIMSFKTGFSGYKDLLLNCFIIYPMFWNSLLYASVITIIQLIIIIPCAFSFANASFKGKGILFIGYIVLMMMPL